MEDIKTPRHACILWVVESGKGKQKPINNGHTNKKIDKKAKYKSIGPKKNIRN